MELVKATGAAENTAESTEGEAGSAAESEQKEEAKTEANAVLSSGGALGIFPEGTRSKNGNTMGEFHSGSFRAAAKAKCPIIPVAFIDSFRVLDQKGSAPVTVKMYYLEPISYAQYASLKTVELADLVKERIAQAIETGLS